MRKTTGITVALLIGLFLLSSTAVHAQKRRYRVGYKDAGFSMIPEVALLLPTDTYKGAVNFNLIGGAMVNGHFFAGGGVALDAYSSDLYVPVFADLRYFFIADQFSPYAFIDAGYGIPVDANPNLGAGMMLNPGFGIKYFVSRTVAVNLSLGYRYQSMPIDNTVPDASLSNRTNYIQSFALRVGLQF